MTAVLFRRLAIVLASASLISCLGGGGAGDDPGGGGSAGAICEGITGGNSSVTTGQSDGCIGCSVDDGGQKAADGDLDSFSSVTAPETFAGQGVTIKVSAQVGIAFAGGQTAAVFFTPPTSSGFAPPEDAITITTYLDGEVQDAPSSFTTREPAQNGTAYWARFFTTTKAFDTVEVMVSNTQVATMPFEIHEICSNTTLQ